MSEAAPLDVRGLSVYAFSRGEVSWGLSVYAFSCGEVPCTILRFKVHPPLQTSYEL